MGFQSRSNSGGAADSSSAASAPMNMVASEIFAANDLVFMDWKTGDTKNLSSVPAAAALAAGPSMTTLTQFDWASMSAGAGACAANSVTLPDGSLLILSGASTQSGEYRTILTLYKYSAKGVFLSKVLISPYSQAMNNVYTQVSMVLLKNGNVAMCYTPGAGVVPRWVIVTQAMQVVASGSVTGTVSGFGVQTIHPTNDGGFIAFGPGGIDTISSTGVKVNTVPIAQGYLATQDEVNGNVAVQDVSNNPEVTNYQPAKISNNGFGFVYWIAGSVNYVQINADGTKRADPVLLAAMTQPPSSWFKYAVGANGNICFVVSPSSGSTAVFGVVSDAGSNVKSSTAITMSTFNTPVYVVSDVSGGFVIVNNFGGNVYIRNLTNLGVDLVGSPRVLGAAGNGSWPFVTLYKLSTGTVVLWTLGQTDYTFKYALVNPAGTTMATGTLFNFAGGNSTMTGTALIKDDCIYGVVTSNSSATTGIPELVSFSITNTGVLFIQQHYVGLTSSGFNAGNALRLVIDYTGRFMHVVGNINSASSVIVTIDLASMYMVQAYMVNYAIAYARIRKVGQSLMFVDTNRAYGWATGSPGVAAIFVKPTPTILLGVTSAPADKGDPLVIKTKGTFPISSVWAQAAQLFDQSANVPPGNAGSINNGLINLKGF